MRNRSRRTRIAKPAGVWLVVFALVVGGVLAQHLPMGRFTDFTIPEFHDPPNDGQLKSLVQGAEAIPQDAGRILINDLKLETFNESGVRELIIQARDCIYDSSAREAGSEGPLHVHTEDGRLTMDGEGFLWRQTNSSLIISNRVHTVIQWKTEDTLEP